MRRPLTLIALACSALACTTPVGGGGGGAVIIGGAPGTPCAPEVHAQGCNTAQKVQCDPTSKTWQDAGTCPSGQFCKTDPDPSDPTSPKKIATCFLPGATSGGGTSGGGTSGGGATDAGGGGSDAAQDSGGTSGGGADTGVATDAGSGPKCGDGECEAGETASTCPQDCKPAGPTCGDGKCEAPENPETCSQDCKPAAVCGDQKCDDGEKNACPFDCSPVAAQISGCVSAKCGSQLAACTKDPACVSMVGKALTCAEGCDGLNAECVAKCATSDTSNPTGFNLLLCASQQNCIAQGPFCGNGKCESGETASSCPADCKASGPTCGDGKCESGETASTCPQDCGGGGGSCGDGKCSKGESANTCSKDCGGGTSPFGLKACWDSGCASETAACKANYVCSGLIKCQKEDKDANACATANGWVQADFDAHGKLLEALQTCAFKACADPNAAKCSDPGKDGAKNRCGQFDNSWPCNCDADCAKYSDCCADYNATCGAP